MLPFTLSLGVVSLDTMSLHLIFKAFTAKQFLLYLAMRFTSTFIVEGLTPASEA